MNTHINKLFLKIDKTTGGNYCDSTPKNLGIGINEQKLNRVDS